MDEDSIKQKLSEHLNAQNVNTEQPGLLPDNFVEPAPIEAFHDNLPLDNMVLRQQTMDFLNVPTGSRSSTDTISQVDAILRWAGENSTSKEVNDLLTTIHQQIRMMGANLKDNKVQLLYRYVKLNSQRLAIETQMRALHG